VTVSDPGGVVTVTGGKLTTYREMAEDTVDAVATLDWAVPHGAGAGDGSA
jgi:glycerol-3-phosphate dehydrogenase